MRVIYAFDVGTTLRNPPNFGWARLDPRLDPLNANRVVGSRDITKLVDYITSDARGGMSIALGVEAPCFIPVPWDASELSRPRIGENDRSWSSQIGACVTTLGLHQTAWILRRLNEKFGGTHLFTTDWNVWPGSNHPILFLWEAFVSDSAHSKDNDNEHVRDAATAVNEFYTNENDLGRINAVTCYPRICIVHAAALWSGWSSDVSGLHDSMLVVRPNQIYANAIGEA